MKLNAIKFLLAVGVLFAMTGCEENPLDADRNYQIVWQDEFDGAAGEAPDSTKWNYDLGVGWGNAQLEASTDRPENVSQDGEGNLMITARQESFGTAGFTSGRITTRGKFEQQYGRFEARIKMPYGPGLWPAFWMLGSPCVPQLFSSGVCCNGTDGWPDCGEIDIVELRGQFPSVMAGTVHGPGYFDGASISQDYALTNNRFDKEYHVFAVEWGEGFIDFFVDDVMYHRVTPEDADGEWVFNQPFYMILNVAVGGNYVGFPVPDTPFPQTMYVDYVRVYREVQ